MSIQSVRKLFRESMKVATPKNNKYLTSGEATRVLAEVSKNGVTKGEVAYLKGVFENGVLTPGSLTGAKPRLTGDAFYMGAATQKKFEAFIAKHDTARRPLNLGELEKPGAALKDHMFDLQPGETLSFKCRENQIWNLGDIVVNPPDALIVVSRILERPPQGLLGGTRLVEYSFRLNTARLPGTQNITVTTRGAHQVRNDPNWAFSFGVRRAAAQRPAFTLGSSDGQ